MPNPENWDDADVKVGVGMMNFISVVMLIMSVFIAFSGFSRWPLLGWPLLAGFVFVILRVFKNMVRNATEAIKMHVERDEDRKWLNIYWDSEGQRSPLLDELIRQRRTASRKTSSLLKQTANPETHPDERKPPSTGLIVFGLIAYTVVLTLFWYGIGRLILVIVRLF